jgi:Lrp/AsnC family transcriptional regulator for asnA, asnC and gidA
MKNKSQIDTLDKKILNIISKDARVPFLEVARECGVSGAAIHQRVQKMVKEGVIKGSEFIVDPKRIGFNTCAYIGIFLEKASMFDEVVERLDQIPEIVECHYTTGNYSIFVKIFAHDNSHLKEVLSDKLQALPGIARTETYISLEERFKRHLPIE